MRALLQRAQVLLLATLLAGCAPGLREGPLRLRQVIWKRQPVEVGHVAAVAELYADTVVVGDRGLQVFTSGLLLSSDPGLRAWRGAVVVPAADKSGEWLLLVDGEGHLLRLRDRRTLEDVADRYGLREVAVQGVAALGDGLVGFPLPVGVAVADGAQVARYRPQLPGLGGGGGRGVALVHGGVRVAGVKQGRLDVREYWVPDAVAAAIDGAGLLVVATQRSLLREDPGGALQPLYELPRRRARTERIWGLAAAGRGVWVGVGARLALVRDGTILTGPPVLGEAKELRGPERLIGGRGGDVWVAGQEGLERYGEDTGSAAAEERWGQRVLPIFTRSCGLCHLPGGSAGIDLSSYRAWSERRGAIEQRVLHGKPRPMPPAGVGTLSDTERRTLRAWLKEP